jgi:DNA invertase Pin-like site-specific DNA recombinase
MSVYSYARISTDMQSESSIDDQHRICRDYAKKQGWKLAAKFDDIGISGAAFGNRPGVREALAVLKTGDVLLVCDLSRLSRSSDLSPALDRLKHRGARCIGVQDGYDSESRSGRLQAGLSGIMSAEFRSMIGDRTRAALEYRARDGRATGGKAFSDPKLVKEIFQRFAGGESLKRIASDLNARNIPSPGAAWKARSNPRGKWLVSALHALLKNEIYIGRKIWNKCQMVKDPDTGKRIRRERPESDWIVTKCEPLIDRPTWDAAQRRFKTLSPHSRAQKFLLSGILECAVCGSKLVIAGGIERRYRCGTNAQGGVHACTNARTFPQQAAEDAIMEDVQAKCLSPAAIAEGIKALKLERAKVERAPVVPNRELLELERLVSLGILTPEVAAPSIAAAKIKSDLTVEAAPVVPLWPSDKAWRESVKGVRTILAGDDVPAARDALRELVGTIPCTPDNAQRGVYLSWSTGSALIRTGTDRVRFCGSGGRI